MPESSPYEFLAFAILIDLRGARKPSELNTRHLYQIRKVTVQKSSEEI